MANLFLDTFTGADGTTINGYNSWTAKTSALASDTGLKIQSNRASATTNGARMAYHTVSSWNKTSATVTLFRYSGTGLRLQNFIVLGSSDVSSYANFSNNGIVISVQRSDHATSNSSLTVSDGTTSVATKSTTFQYDGTDLVVSFTMNANGSGSVVITQGASSDTLSWAARTWTNGGGTNFGIKLDSNGTDGTGRTTTSGFDTFSIDNIVAFIPTIMMA